MVEVHERADHPRDQHRRAEGDLQSPSCMIKHVGARRPTDELLMSR